MAVDDREITKKLTGKNESLIIVMCTKDNMTPSWKDQLVKLLTYSFPSELNEEQVLRMVVENSAQDFWYLVLERQTLRTKRMKPGRLAKGKYTIVDELVDTWVARTELVACCSVEATRNRGWLATHRMNNVCVDKAFRRQGIGTFLLDHVRAMFPKMYMQLDSNNPGALLFYQSLGYFA